MAEAKQGPMTAAAAVYLAGVGLSFGIRLGQMPLPDLDGDPISVGAFLVMAFFHLVLSVATSWLGAGLALGNP